MFKGSRIFMVTFVLLLGVILLSTIGIAANKPNPQAALEKFISCHRQDPIKIANDYLDKMQLVYQTENLSQFLNLYNDPVVAVDVVRDINEFYTKERLSNEINEMFQLFTGVQCIFENRQINFEGDMIMIRAMRSFTANEFPMIAKCDMLMVLRQNHRQPWSFITTDQILMHEEYIPKTSPGNQLNLQAAPMQKDSKLKTNHLLW